MNWVFLVVIALVAVSTLTFALEDTDSCFNYKTSAECVKYTQTGSAGGDCTFCVTDDGKSTETSKCYPLPTANRYIKYYATTTTTFTCTNADGPLLNNPTAAPTPGPLSSGENYAETCTTYMQDQVNCAKHYMLVDGKPQACAHCSGNRYLKVADPSTRTFVQEFCIPEGSTGAYIKKYDTEIDPNKPCDVDHPENCPTFEPGTFQCSANNDMNGDDDAVVASDDDSVPAECEANTYSKTGAAPCTKCPAGHTSGTGATVCVSSGKEVGSGGASRSKVDSCRTPADSSTCLASYQMSSDAVDKCAWCVGSAMGQTQSSCINEGGIAGYSSQVLSMGGTIDCTQNDDDSGSGSTDDTAATDDTTTTDDGGASSCKGDQTWDSSLNKCVCPAGKKWVASQNQCVTANLCPCMYASSDGYEPCDRCDVGQKSSKQSGSTTCIPESQAGGCGGSDDDPSTGRSEVNNCQSIKNDQTTCDDSYQVVNGKNEDCAYCVAKGLPSGDAVYCINSGSTTHYIQQTEMLGATMTCTLNSDTDDAGQGPLSDDAEPTKAPTSAPNGNGKETITDCRVYSELSDASNCNNAQVGNSTSTIKPCTFCTGSAMGQKRYFCLDSSLTGFYSEQFKAKGGTLTCQADQDKCRANEEKEDPEDASSKCVCVSLYRRDPATKKCVEAPTCPIGYYSSTGFTPCYRCEDGKTSSASQGGFTRCFTPGDNSGGNGVPDDVQDRTLVADCRKYYENPTQCDKSYMTVDAGHNEDCSYCTGTIPNREGTNTYCVHAGRTSFYETQFKNMGGELECSLTSDVDADGDDDAVDMPPTYDKCPLGQTMDDATQKCVNNPPCAPGTFSPSGNVPCLHCGLNSQAKESGSRECVPEESLVDNRPNACPAGKYSDTGTFTVTKKCTACPAGKTSSRPRGSIECTSCDSLPYFYSAESGSTYCSVCNFTEVANADHTGCINSGVNPKDEVKLVSDCHDFDNNEDKCTDRYMVPLGNGKKDWCSFCSYGPKITSERKTSCMPNSATRFYKYNAEAKNEFFECTKAETEDSNGQGGGGATPSMAPTKKGGGGGGGGSTTAPPTPKPSAAPTGKSDPYAALSGADAEKGGNAGLVVGMVFLSLFLVGMFAAAVYFRTHIEKSDTFQTVRKSVRRSLGMQEEDSTAAPAEGDTPVRKTTMIPHKSPSITMMQQQGDMGMGMGSMHSNPMHGTNVSGHGASVASAAVTTAPFSSGESFEGSNPLHASNTLVKDTVPEPHAPTTAAPAASLADIEASL